jgi:hypothetical protein
MDVAIFVLVVKATWVVGFGFLGVEWLEDRGLRLGKKRRRGCEGTPVKSNQDYRARQGV